MHGGRRGAGGARATALLGVLCAGCSSPGVVPTGDAGDALTALRDTTAGGDPCAPGCDAGVDAAVDGPRAPDAPGDALDARVEAPDAPPSDLAAEAEAPPPPPPPPMAPRPAVGASWHIDLEAPVDTSVRADWYDVDLFDSAEAVAGPLHARGARVVCYFSAGSSEDWRPDFAMFPRSALGAPLDGWSGERWLDVRDAGVRRVMQGRLDLARRRGCDGVDPDNVDGYANASGFGLRAEDQLEYNRWLASQAHARGLLVGLKNDVEQVPALLADFDFAVNESCFMFNECDAVAAFTRGARAVLSIEYGDVSALSRSVCPRASALRFFTILPGADRLNGSYTRCTDGVAVR